MSGAPQLGVADQNDLGIGDAFDAVRVRERHGAHPRPGRGIDEVEPQPQLQGLAGVLRAQLRRGRAEHHRERRGDQAPVGELGTRHGGFGRTVGADALVALYGLAVRRVDDGRAWADRIAGLRPLSVVSVRLCKGRVL